MGKGESSKEWVEKAFSGNKVGSQSSDGGSDFGKPKSKKKNKKSNKKVTFDLSATNKQVDIGHVDGKPLVCTTNHEDSLSFEEDQPELNLVSMEVHSGDRPASTVESPGKSHSPS